MKPIFSFSMVILSVLCVSLFSISLIGQSGRGDKMGWTKWVDTRMHGYHIYQAKGKRYVKESLAYNPIAFDCSEIPLR